MSMGKTSTKGKNKPDNKEKPAPKKAGSDPFDAFSKSLDKLYGKKGDGSNRTEG